MTIMAISEGDTLRVIGSTEPLAHGAEMILYTADEIERLVAERQWGSLPPSSREDMMFQTQSASYRDWMDEDDWDRIREQAAQTLLPLAEFKPR